MTLRSPGCAGRLASAVLCVTLASAADPSAPTWPALVLEGERLWKESPVPGNPVACATCHHDTGAVRAWAASFPKVKPLPPPDTRVMTLLQANAEAVARHYRPRDPRPAAAAITAYLGALGAGVPVSPGLALGQPVLPKRLLTLAASVARGRARYGRECSVCHDARAPAPAAAWFPREVDGRVEWLEDFLAEHAARARGKERLAWDAPEMADLVAYLVSHLAGRPQEVGAPATGREVSP